MDLVTFAKRIQEVLLPLRTVVRKNYRKWTVDLYRFQVDNAIRNCPYRPDLIQALPLGTTSCSSYSLNRAAIIIWKLSSLNDSKEGVGFLSRRTPRCACERFPVSSSGIQAEVWMELL